MPGAALRFAEVSALAADLERMADPPARTLIERGLVVLPAAAEPGVFDAALTLARQLQQARSQAGAPVPWAFVFPVMVELDARGARLLAGPWLEDLDRRSPRLAPGTCALTSHAALALEESWPTTDLPAYRAPSGRTLPLVAVTGSAAEGPRPRNLSLLGRPLPHLERSALRPVVEAARRAPAFLLSGSLGCGKTSLVVAELADASQLRVWIRLPAPAPDQGQLAARILAALRRSDDPAALEEDAQRLDAEIVKTAVAPGEIAARLARLLARCPPRSTGGRHLVFDQLERASDSDRELVAALLDRPELGVSYRLTLISRDPEEAFSASRLERHAMRPWTADETEELLAPIARDLSLPAAAAERLAAAAGGCPFALEEGLVAMMRGDQIRRVYGSFFYAREGAGSYVPSERLVRHLDAEARRLSADVALRALAAVELAMPANEIRSLVSMLGATVPRRWEDRAAAAGLLVSAESPWGPAVEPSCRAFTSALAAALGAETVAEIRQCAGELLAAASTEAGAQWSAYGLLAGSEEGVASLLAGLESRAAASASRSEVLATLRREIDQARRRGVEPSVELELLWRLLPLARRTGQLHEVRDELARAVELAADDPQRLLAFAAIKAEIDQEEGRFAAAEKTLRFALERSGPESRKKTLLLIQLGRLLMRQHRPEPATEIFRNLLAALPATGSGAVAAICRFYLGNLALAARRPEEALALHRQALEERRRQGLFHAAGASLSALGATCLALGDYPAALAHYREAESVLAEHGAEGEISFALIGIGRTLTRLGDYLGASQPLRRALALRQGKDQPVGEALARLAVAENHLDLGQLDKALDEVRQAHFQLNLLPAGVHLGAAEQALGRIQLQTRRFAEAERSFQRALEIHRAARDPDTASLDLSWLVVNALARDDDEESVRRAVANLEASVGAAAGPPDEEVSFRLFRGLERLRQLGYEVNDPRLHLERAYRTLLDHARHLGPELRNRFLFQIPEHQAILESASAYGLAAE